VLRTGVGGCSNWRCQKRTGKMKNKSGSIVNIRDRVGVNYTMVWKLDSESVRNLSPKFRREASAVSGGLSN
jgi:membrane glycosyltransferase